MIDGTAPRLSDVWREHRAPHVVTVLDGRAHVVPVTLDVDGGAFRVVAPSLSYGHRRPTAGTA